MKQTQGSRGEAEQANRILTACADDSPAANEPMGLVPSDEEAFCDSALARFEWEGGLTLKETDYYRDGVTSNRAHQVSDASNAVQFRSKRMGARRRPEVSPPRLNQG